MIKGIGLAPFSCTVWSRLHRHAVEKSVGNESAMVVLEVCGNFNFKQFLLA